VGVVGSMGGALAKRVAPNLTGPVVRQVLERAIDGFGPISGAVASAETALRKNSGDTDRAIEDLIDQHVRWAGAQGFLTNVGGLVTMVVSAPANITAVALLQCHLAAAIVHLRGYDLDKPAVRDAVLVCLLDKDARKSLARDAKQDISPSVLAASQHGPALAQLISQAVTGQLLAAVGGKRVASFVARRIPVLGGAVGAAGDALATRRIGMSTAALPRPLKYIGPANRSAK